MTKRPASDAARRSREYLVGESGLVQWWCGRGALVVRVLCQVGPGLSWAGLA